MKATLIALSVALLLAAVLPPAATARTAPAAELPPPTAPRLLAEEEGRLLPVGKVAPDFNLPQVGGGELSLANTLKVSKWVLVNFWTSKSEPSKTELKTLQKLFDAYGDKGLDIIAIDPVDSAKAIQKLMTDGQYSFKAAVDGNETNHAVTDVYHALGHYPTTYLLDNGGKVLWGATGFDEAALRAALTKAGLK